MKDADGKELPAKDALDVYLISLHTLLGHDTTARYIGVDPGNKDDCRLCHPELVAATQ